MRKNVVTQIRQYHTAVVNADKSIAEVGKEQIRAAYKCGELLAQQRMKCPSNGWGKWCKKNLPDMSKSTIGRYILLTEVSDLTHLETYRTLNAAYVGEGITSAPRQRITIKTVTPAEPTTVATTTVPAADLEGVPIQYDNRSVSPGRQNGDGANGIDLKAKVKGGGNLGDLLNKVSPNARVQIQSQLRDAPDGGQAQRATFPTPEAYVERASDHEECGTARKQKIDPSQISGEEIARLFEMARLIDALLLQLNRSAESNDAAEIAACASSMKSLIEWYEKYAVKANVALAA